MEGTMMRLAAAGATLALLAACATDRPPDPATLVQPQALLQELAGNTLKGRSSASASVSFYESTDRMRFRTTMLSSGQEFTDTGAIMAQGEAVCLTPDTVWDRRSFCSRYYRTPTGFRAVPTDNRPGSVMELLPGNPENL